MIDVPTAGRQTKSTSSESLIGMDGNGFAIVAIVGRDLRRAGASAEFVSEFRREATSGDYNHLLATAMEYLDAEPIEADQD